ncbi:NUMOD1 domain-containing DNA-binding protein [Pseudotenacibaculum haliotis]|uniref:NUMOD1 domain-containing DNA-binding protein n=1 Tax=Pseudotenacibaculum haliotis TaxID=1862138 RepID=A0ABW5LV45_9FLAO
MENKKPKIVYRIVNTITLETYIGVTTTSLEIRKRDHLSKAKNNTGGKLYESMATYGIENFKFQVVDTTLDTMNELAEKEKSLIRKNKEEGLSLNSDSGGGVPKKVYQYSLEGKFLREFNSLKDASNECNVSNKKISKACTGSSTKAGNFYWSYVKSDSILPKVDRRVKIVYKLSPDSGHIIDKFESVASASRITGVLKSSIAKVCRGERKTAGGYKWKYG